MRQRRGESRRGGGGLGGIGRRRSDREIDAGLHQLTTPLLRIGRAFQENPFQVDRHRAISGRELGTAQDSVAQQEGEEGVEYGLSKTWYSGPLLEKVVGWACLVAISAGVTSRTAAGLPMAGPRYNEPSACRREKVGRCLSRTIVPPILAHGNEEGPEEKRRTNRMKRSESALRCFRSWPHSPEGRPQDGLMGRN
ncbi:uncharacterized protein LOC143908206 [Temnothorax americanus]|uniref:uncharacterized protein LOC143908206 n=1 Tax=Temnothorax americanus TaxID=1964332 RepID=UPI004069717C